MSLRRHSNLYVNEDPGAAQYLHVDILSSGSEDLWPP